MEFYFILLHSEQILIISSVGLNFDQIAKCISGNEVWLAAAFSGQSLYQ